MVLNFVSDKIAGVGEAALQEAKSIFCTDTIKKYFTVENSTKLILDCLIILVIFLLYALIKKILLKRLAKIVKPTTLNSISRGVGYLFYIIVTLFILHLLGIKLSAVWGAAGIAGIAIGFAAQTTISNLISGVFVITEKSLKVGDYIEIDGVSGIVDSVSFLSVRVHTLDNQYIRIPNSTIINSILKNYSTFEFRRYQFEFSVDYNSDLDRVNNAILQVPARCETVICDKPEYAPALYFSSLASSGIVLTLTVWSRRIDFLQTKSDICKNIIEVCRENKISIPYDKVDVHLY